MKAQFGVYLPNIPPPLFEELAKQAESLGFDSIWLSDHLMSPFPPVFPGFSGWLEGWSALCYLGGVTKKIKLSHQVLVPAFRGPALLANMTATLDLLTQGRLILTTGAGWYRKEFDSYGIPWEAHEERLRRERECIEIVRALWTREKVTYSGKYYKLEDAVLEPKPFQTPSPPVWIGGDSRGTVELACDLGDGWLMHGHTPEEAGKMISYMKRLLEGKNKPMTCAISLFVAMGGSKSEAEEKIQQSIPNDLLQAIMEAPARRELKNRLSGSTAECTSKIREYIAAGIGHFVLAFLDPGDMVRFSEEVLPEFRV